MSNYTKRALALLVAGALGLTACAAQTPGTPQTPGGSEGTTDTVKIGFISAFTGVFSSFGKMQREGAELALDEAGFKAGGKQIEVIYEDDQLDNEIAVTKAKKLVEQDQVHVLTGLVSGDEGLAVGDYMKDKEIPVVVMYSAAEDMTMRSFSENIVRPTWTGAQSMDVFGYWLAKEKGYKKIYQIGEDYSFPWNTGGGFKRGFCRGGGTEVKSVWFPPGTTSDFSSLIASIPLDQGYDALFYNGAGGAAVNFIKQYVELGMIGKMPLVGQPNTFEKPDLDSMPADIAGSLSPQHTADDLSTPEWTTFADAFRAKYGYAPSAAAEFAYSSMKLILRSIDQTNGNVEDSKALIAAMTSTDITDDPRGPVKLDPKWHSATQNVYIREVTKDDSGALYNKGLLTVTEVSQFGVYDPDVYMAAPSDSNTSPSDQCADLGALLTAPAEYQYKPFGS
ncbi:MAG: ABC transporter substrate-binding protein [Propionibacteriaceae bacterium]|nr:ABC transporter substrate-binding protein [Propionibacteriaceae bacterium]